MPLVLFHIPYYIQAHLRLAQRRHITQLILDSLLGQTPFFLVRIWWPVISHIPCGPAPQCEVFTTLVLAAVHGVQSPMCNPSPGNLYVALSHADSPSGCSGLLGIRTLGNAASGNAGKTLLVLKLSLRSTWAELKLYCVPLLPRELKLHLFCIHLVSAAFHPFHVRSISNQSSALSFRSTLVVNSFDCPTHSKERWPRGATLCLSTAPLLLELRLTWPKAGCAQLPSTFMSTQKA